MAKKSKKSAAKKSSAKSKTPSRKPSSVKTSARKTVNKTSPAANNRTASNSNSSSDRVLEYKLFTEDSVRNLEDQVNYHIRKGWAPVGGVVVQSQGVFIQTMVRHAI